jgi:hypothetical protein
VSRVPGDLGVGGGVRAEEAFERIDAQAVAQRQPQRRGDQRDHGEHDGYLYEPALPGHGGPSTVEAVAGVPEEPASPGELDRPDRQATEDDEPARAGQGYEKNAGGHHDEPGEGHKNAKGESPPRRGVEMSPNSRSYCPD